MGHLQEKRSVEAALTGTMSSCACSLLLARDSPGTSPERCAVRLLDLGGLKGGLQTSAGPKCCGSDGGFANAAQVASLDQAWLHS